MRRLRNLLILPAKIQSLQKQLRYQKEFVHKTLHPILVKYYKSNDGTLANFDFEKITNYYGVGSPVLAGEGISIMHNEVFDSKTREILTLMGAITGLYDDFFDRSNHSIEDIKKLSSVENNFNGHSTHEKLFRELSFKIFNLVSDKQRLLLYSDKVFVAQKESIKQKDDNTPISELKNISFKKGGESLLFYRCSFAKHISEEEQEILFQIGGFVQLCNDIFDINKDIKEGIRTFATECNNIADLKKEIKTTKEKVYSICLGLEEKLNVKGFLNQVNVIYAQSLTALDFYYNTQQNNGKKFTPKEYPREKLVCDMGKPANLFRAGMHWINNC